MKKKIFIVGSKWVYDQMPDTIKALEERGFEVVLPNSYDDHLMEEKMRKEGQEAHDAWKADMIRLGARKVEKADILLVMNMEKNGVPNYIGAGTFMEIYEAFKVGKPIYLYNPIPDNMLKDELEGMTPIVIKGDLEKIQV